MRAGIPPRVRSAVAARRRRLTTTDLWPLVQVTAAATAAWLIARAIADDREPFFAPVAALVSLNAALGERGLNALRLLQGVVLGIGVGELTVLVLRGGYGSVALGTFVALVLARLLGGARIVHAQAAIGAILTITSADGEVAFHRLFDALIGVAVALIFSQLLFTPDPLRLLRRIETTALEAMAEGLELTALGLDGEDEQADRAIRSQRELRDHLSELARLRGATARVARHSLVWRGRIRPLVRENEDAGHLDLLGGSCLLLTRTSLATDEDDQRRLLPSIRSLATILADLAGQPGDLPTRQRAVDRGLEVLRDMRAIVPGPTERSSDLSGALAAARLAVTDLMLFVGVDPDDSAAATREEAAAGVHIEARTGAPADTSAADQIMGWLRRRRRRAAKVLSAWRRARRDAVRS